MSGAELIWRVNIAEAFGQFQVGLDDLGIDADGRIYVGDGVNSSVCRLRPEGETDAVFDVMKPAPFRGEEPGMNIAVGCDSFYVADPGNERVFRYDSLGQNVGEFSASGVIAISRAPEDSVHVLASGADGERIDCYDTIGSHAGSLCAPRRYRAHLDPELASIDVDTSGSVYVSYGMPPYRVWRIARPDSDPEITQDDAQCGDITEPWGRALDHPEDAVLVSDLAFDPAEGVLRVLLACRESGRQVLDTFSTVGEYLGPIPLPHSDNLYTAICSAGDGYFLLLDGAAGELLRMRLTP